MLPLVEPLDSSLEEVDVFRRLAKLPHVVFFDSAARHARLGRYSFVAADPIEWISVESRRPDAFALLGQRMAESGLSISNMPSAFSNLWSDRPPFQGGWAGLLGYELACSLEKVPAAEFDEFQLPVIAMGLYDVVVAFDHISKTAWLISQGIPERDFASRRERAATRLAEFRNYLSSQSRWNTDNGTMRSPSLPHARLAPQFAISGHDHLTSTFSAESYQKAVRQAIDYIHAGDVFQVNLSQRLLYPAIASPVELYCRLRRRNPAPFAGYLDGGQWQIVSASPERFIRVDRTRVETRPIKGTRARSHRPEADLFAGDELRSSEKDRAENVMIVDLLRNDLSRTCRPQSVCVSQLCELETYEYVQHLVSVVEGELREGLTCLDVLRTSFPGGSVTGAPKIRAMEIIAELEPTVRGAYCGSLCYIGLDGRMDSSILIRTVTAAGGWWQLPVGGGIVAQSNPRDEYDETWHKAVGLLRALQP